MPNHHGSNPPRQRTYTEIFPDEGHLKTESCPDCLANGNLNVLGRPFRTHREPLRPVSGALPHNPLSSVGCETCGGTGRVVVGFGDAYKRPKKG